jgi:asparagine synthase (glutamine-hydrolysing)
MCGFVSYISLTGTAPDRGVVTRMTERIAHRGPDDVGYFYEDCVAFGFRRLAILDLASSGHQPMISADGRCVIVFNGEIYNYVELRNELASLGHRFVSSGDTEVLLAAYLQWGADCLPRLNGMWAFAIYDRTTRRIFGARDRFGVKPLYVHKSADCVLLASEIKSIRDSGAARVQVDWTTAASFLVESRLDHSAQTFYESIEALPAGTAFEADCDGKWKQWRYWDLDEAAGAIQLPSDPIATFGELFEDAVRLRLRSDVPVGVLLSGGLDSTSIICSMARQLTGAGELGAYCFSAADFDESDQVAATVAQTNADVRHLDLDPLQFWNSISEHLWHQDEPVHSFASVVGYRLMKLARSSGVTVLLNGQGADEYLAGYPTYYGDYISELIADLQWGRAWSVSRAYALVHGEDPALVARRSLRRTVGHVLHRFAWYGALSNSRSRSDAQHEAWVSPDVFARWKQTRAPAPTTLHAALKKSMQQENLPLYLRIEDRNSMAHATEVRLPFLDYRLVTLGFRLGADAKLRDGIGKYILRESMRGRIPEVVRARKTKFGFPVPTERWFRDELYAPMRELLASRFVRESGLWNLSIVERDLERHRRGEISVGGRLFDVAQFSMWMNAQAEWTGRASTTLS